jgi:hypothetical protein
MSTGAQGNSEGYLSGSATVASQTPNHAGNESPIFVPPPEPNNNPLSTVEILQPVNASPPAAAAAHKAYKSRQEVTWRFGWARYSSTRVVESVGSANPPRPAKSGGRFGSLGAIVSAALASLRGLFGGQ